MGDNNWLEKLKERWKLQSLYQVIIVLIVFGITGTTVYLLKKPILSLLPISFRDSWLFTLLYFVFILPVYNIILLIYGFLFGQFSFFWEFEKRTYRRIFKKKKG